MSLASSLALGSGLSLQETQQREAQAELLLLQCWGEDKKAMVQDTANKRSEMDQTEEPERERDAKYSRPDSKGGYGRGGRGKGNQPKANGPRRQPFRRSAETEAGAPEGMMWLLGKLLLRHEDQMGIDKTQNSFVMFFKRESALSLIPLFVQKSQHWNALKEQKQEKMDEIALPLRTFLFHTLLEALVKRIKDTVQNDEQLKTATTLQVFLPRDGDAELQVPFLSYNQETKTLAPRQDLQPLPVSTMLEKLQVLQKQCLCPLAIMRFHSTQRLSGPLQGPTVPFLLQVGHRSPEAAELYLSLRSLANSAIWQLVGGSLRPEKMGRSALATELARRLQGPFTQSDLVRGHAFSHAENDYTGLAVWPAPWRAGRDEPFSNLQLLGTDYALRDTLAGYLGEECELESAMIITVDPGAPAQNAHVDTQDEGSVSVHIPMHSLHDGFAPLGFCMGSHIDPSVLSAPPRLKLRGAERRQKAEEALHRQTRATAKEEHFLQWGPSEVALLPAVDFRRGAMRVLVRNFRDDAAEALGLQQGDEVTHVNDLDFVTWLEVKDHVPELRDNIVARVLRPVTEPNAAEALEEELPALSAAPADSSQSQAPSRLRAWFNTKRYADRMLVGAPLNIGDALIYDSRTVHWGMANCESYPRYVLYLNFKRGAFRGCSPDAIAKRSASVRCLQERGRFQDRFKRELHYMA
ncbi:unnamed protein product [Symbiodinium sp. CCMP2592]|nr:unnamed protein product [Symbiodinium sp. CCMP2592]